MCVINVIYLGFQPPEKRLDLLPFGRRDHPLIRLVLGLPLVLLALRSRFAHVLPFAVAAARRGGAGVAASFARRGQTLSLLLGFVELLVRVVLLRESVDGVLRTVMVLRLYRQGGQTFVYGDRWVRRVSLHFLSETN